MFANDLGIIDDLTLDTYLRLVPPQILAGTHYKISDAESPRIPVPLSPIPLLDIGCISPDPADVRECTRQLELYYRVAMEVQDVDAQPLCCGNKPYPGGVRAYSRKWCRCYVYLKQGETLRVRRGEKKSAHRVRVLELMLGQMCRGYRRQVAKAFPQLNPRFMFIYEGRVFRIRPKAQIILTPLHHQTFLEIRNTAWCVTVPILEYTLAMSKFIKQSLVTDLIANDQNFEKLT
jgi:hypothetical protein